MATDIHLVSFFPNKLRPKLRDISLIELTEMIRTGDYNIDNYNQLRDIVEQLEQIEDKKTRDEFKGRKLPAVTVSGVFASGHKGEDFQKPSGLLQIDFDWHNDPDPARKVARLRRKFQKDRYTLVCCGSPSRRGLKLLIRIPEHWNATDHKKSFKAAYNYYLQQYGEKIDSSCQDINRLMFLTYDPDIFVNWNAKVFTELKEDGAANASEHKTAAPVPELTIEESVKLHEHAQTFLYYIIKYKIDIAPDYEQWIKVAYAMRNVFGEEGRIYFHLISKQWYRGYDAEMTEKKYDELMRHSPKEGGAGMGTYVHLFKEALKDKKRPELKRLWFLFDDLELLIGEPQQAPPEIPAEVETAPHVPQLEQKTSTTQQDSATLSKTADNKEKTKASKKGKQPQQAEDNLINSLKQIADELYLNKEWGYSTWRLIERIRSVKKVSIGRAITGARMMIDHKIVIPIVDASSTALHIDELETNSTQFVASKPEAEVFYVLNRSKEN